MEIPLQGHAALWVGGLAIFITMFVLIMSLLPEKKRQADQDDH